jgi:hypothetical protein
VIEKMAFIDLNSKQTLSFLYFFLGNSRSYNQVIFLVYGSRMAIGVGGGGGLKTKSSLELMKDRVFYIIDIL